MSLIFNGMTLQLRRAQAKGCAASYGIVASSGNMATEENTRIIGIVVCNGGVASTY